MYMTSLPLARDRLPSRAILVECFTEGGSHQMETKGEASF